MKLVLRPVASLEEALAFAPTLDEHAAQFAAQFSDQPFPRGASARFLASHIGARETVLIVAEGEGRSAPVGLCLVGPLADPLTGVTLPLVLVLYVDASLRHRGIAGELVAEVEQVLRARGIEQLAARAGHNDDALVSMGERWGFVRAWELMIKE
jgi:GNAT superfamily N-acetyltransferase